jgi:hypothetical protein
MNRGGDYLHDLAYSTVGVRLSGPSLDHMFSPLCFRVSAVHAIDFGFDISTKNESNDQVSRRLRGRNLG